MTGHGDDAAAGHCFAGLIAGRGNKNGGPGRRCRWGVRSAQRGPSAAAHQEAELISRCQDSAGAIWLDNWLTIGALLTRGKVGELDEEGANHTALSTEAAVTS